MKDNIWEYFNIKIITIPQSNFTRIHKDMKNSNIKKYEIKTFKPAKNIKNIGTKNLGLLDIMEYNNVDNTSRNITKNHISVMKDAIKDNLEHILILEDDAVFMKNIEDKLRRIITWIVSNKNKWDIIYFGYCPWPVLYSTLETKDIVKVRTPLLAHSYLINKKGIHKVLSTYSKNKSYSPEKLLLNSKLNKYGIFPSICHQVESPGLYKKAMEKLNININHNTLFSTLEYISIIIPFIFYFILIYIILKVKKFLKNK